MSFLDCPNIFHSHYTNKSICISLQGCPDLLFPKKKFIGPKRMSLSAPVEGSMTVEAAVVLPLFLFAVVNILSLFLMFQTFGNELAKLHQLGREAAMIGYEKSGADTEDDNMVKLLKMSRVKPIIPVAAYEGSLIVNCCYMRMWNGYDAKLADGTYTAGEEIVYITENGAVYHTNRNCSNLELAIRLVDKSELSVQRNASGEKYHACEKCGADKEQEVYITKEGNRYHNSLGCSGLKRTVTAIRISEINGRPKCSKCG